jgi:transcriptional regulator with XRE-family HTH domain
MNAVLEIHPPPAAESPLARARLHRQLTTEEAARRAGLSEEAVLWLEEGRVYRFPSADEALLAMLLYTTALGIDHDEALGLAGRPAAPGPLRQNPWTRLSVLGGVLLAVAALAGVVFYAGGAHHRSAAAAQRSAPTLPAPWTIHVTVLNGSGDIGATRELASRIQSLGYAIAKVGPANNFRYQQTVVFYPPGGGPIALRLAKQLGVNVAPLPGGADPRALVVVSGPPTIG